MSGTGADVREIVQELDAEGSGYQNARQPTC